MPRYYIEWGEILFCSKEFTAKLLNNHITGMGALVEPGHRNEKVPWRSKTISPYTNEIHTMDTIKLIFWFGGLMKYARGK